MNPFLWLGAASTAVLIASFLFDGLDEVLDALDAGPWLSLPAIAAFLGAFGFGTGAFIDSLGAPALLIGAATGVAFAYGAVRLSTAMIHMPTDRTDAAADLLASFGRIVTSPSPGRYGEVLLQRPQGPVKVACTADEALAPGTEVVVVDVRSSTLVAVEPFDPHDHPTP